MDRWEEGSAYGISGTIVQVFKMKFQGADDIYSIFKPLEVNQIILGEKAKGNFLQITLY